MQPVNCFWVGLRVCFSYHSEKEKESFIVEEKKKTATLALIVGGMFSLRALLQLNNVFAKFSVLALLWVLAYAALAAVFFLKNSQFRGHILTCAIGVDIPVGEPFYLLVFQFTAEKIVILGIFVYFLSYRGIKITL